MALLPKSKLGKIQWYLNHVTPWTTNTTQIGLVLADVTAVSTAATAAMTAYTAQQVAQQAAKTATLDLETKLRTLQTAGSGAIHKIRGKAVAAGGGADAIYVLADMAAPTPPSPLGDPGTAYGLKLTLNPDGTLTFTWKCDNPAGSVGTIYTLRRKLAGQTAFAAVGSSGARRFTDDSIPAGTPSAVYEITAVRSTRSGTAAQFVVNFGVSTAGEAFATVAAAAPSPKLAA